MSLNSVGFPSESDVDVLEARLDVEEVPALTDASLAIECRPQADIVDLNTIPFYCSRSLISVLL